MAVYFKKSGNTTYFAGHQIDYTWEVFDRDIWPSPTESQTIVIQEPFSIVNYEGSGLFMGCASLENCSDMFYECQALTEIITEENVDWSTEARNLYSHDGMFSYCYRLPYYSYYNITDIRGANTNRYFKGVWNWSSKAYTPYEKVDGYWEEISVYVKDSNNWFTTEVYK